MSYLLGVDVGTTSIKCVLFNLEGKVVASGRREYKLSMPQPDFVEVGAEVYWNAFKECVNEVLKESNVTSKSILGIGISSQGETFVVLDKKGKPLRKAIVWLDNRAKEEANIIRKEFGADNIYSITGQNEVIPTWTATKILWLKRNEPSVFKKATKYLLLKDYLIYKLTDKFITEYSIACSSLLFNISHKKWWSEMLDFIGIDEQQLPEIRPPGTSAGNITKEVAKETGLHTSCVVSTGVYDQASNAIGAGNISSGVITETTGGALSIVATIDHIILDPMRRVPCHHHAILDKYFLQPWCPTAGLILKWYRDNLGLLEVNIANKINLDPYDLLVLEASKAPPGSDGLILLPHFAGAACPDFNSNAKGVLFGLTLYHTRSHIIRAIMESVAYILRRNIEFLEGLGIEVKEIRSTGGGAKSSLWNQIKADVVQKPVLQVYHEETAALGAALLAGLSANVFSSIEDACGSMVKIKEKFIPSKINKDIYDELYKKYIEIHNKIFG